MNILQGGTIGKLTFIPSEYMVALEVKKSLP